MYMYMYCVYINMYVGACVYVCMCLCVHVCVYVCMSADQLTIILNLLLLRGKILLENSCIGWANYQCRYAC